MQSATATQYELYEKEIEIVFLERCFKAERIRSKAAMAPTGDNNKITIEYLKSLILAHKTRCASYKKLYEEIFVQALEHGAI